MPTHLLSDTEKHGSKWNDDELAIAVQGYLATLKKKVKGESVVADDVVSDLHKNSLSWRTRRSIELRMQNISSVLYGLKYPTISEWQPAHNVGSGVKQRIIALLDSANLKTLEAYAKTSSRQCLEERTSLLRKEENLSEPDGTSIPKWENKNVRAFYRDPRIKAWILRNSKGICEGCGSPAHFLGADGLPYLEVHHIVPLSIGGSDSTTNTVALCPNCHMRCHYSMDRDEFKLHLYQTITRLKIEVPEPALSTESNDAE